LNALQSLLSAAPHPGGQASDFRPRAPGGRKKADPGCRSSSGLGSSLRAARSPAPDAAADPVISGRWARGGGECAEGPLLRAVPQRPVGPIDTYRVAMPVLRYRGGTSSWSQPRALSRQPACRWRPLSSRSARGSKLPVPRALPPPRAIRRGETWQQRDGPGPTVASTAVGCGRRAQPCLRSRGTGSRAEEH